MKISMIALLLFSFSSVSFASEQTEMIQTDLKLLCQIEKVEKNLLKDKKMNAADIVERVSAMKLAGVKAQETKSALAAVSAADKREQGKLWKQFAKDNKVKSECI